MEEIKAITPNEVTTAVKAKRVPREVIKLVNELLIEATPSFFGERKFTQAQIVEKILSETNIERPNIFSENMLDFEPEYEEMGWNVSFRKQAYYTNESNYWIFTVRESN